jgi:AcrR family transcriptional regulator
VPRDSRKTKQRILEAGVVEFAQHGIAGARIDRIAERAGVNKALIYTHFEGKEALFSAAFDVIVEQTTAAVPFNDAGVVDYVDRLFDYHLEHPEGVRLANWHRLERSEEPPPAVVDSLTEKLARIKAAQDGGELATSFAAEDILMFAIYLSQLGAPAHLLAGDEADLEAIRRRKQPVLRLLQLLADAD